MQFKFYDDVDPDQVHDIMLVCHNEPSDAKTVARIRRNDPLCSPWFRMYAVEGDKVMSQVGAQYPEIETTQGRMKVGFIEAVAAMPSHARQGITTALMREVHEQMESDGVELFVLGTSKILVAYSMYPKLGYHEMMDFNWGMKKGQNYPKSDIKLKIRKHKVDNGNGMFRELVKENIGFVHRPDDYPRLKSSWGPMYQNAVTFLRAEEPIGYALVRTFPDFLIIRELVCPILADYEPCLQALERNYQRDYVSRSVLGRPDIIKQFKKHGFRDMETWSPFMAMDPKGKMNQKELRQLLGIDKGNFQLFGLDTY